MKHEGTGRLLLSNAVQCPGCNITLDVGPGGPARCANCNWTGDVYVFAARPVRIDIAEAALPDDAACLHHPRKRATAVCAGTGDYICALCTVDIDGQPYSAAYLDAGGKKVAANAFDRTLTRPDSHVYLYLLLLFVPYINAVMILLAFVWLPHAFILYFRALRLRRENPLFARLMGRVTVVTQPILLTLVSLGWLAGVGLSVYFLQEHRHGR